MTTRATADADLVEVFVERHMTSLPAARDIFPGVECCNGCFSLHRVEWQETRLVAEGSRIIYRFRARDVESVRAVLRNTGIECDKLWLVSQSH